MPAPEGNSHEPTTATSSEREVAQPTRRKRRSPRQVLRESPKDWLLERCAIPANCLEWALCLGAPMVFGAPVGAMMQLNFWLGRIPPAANLVRSAEHRDVTYWTRSSMRQDETVTPEPQPPMETDPNVKGVPRWVRSLAKNSQKDDWFSRNVLGFLDDLVCSRARHPDLILGMALMLIGTFVVPVPFIILVPFERLVTYLPRLLSLSIAIKNPVPGATGTGIKAWISNRSWMRYTRPGIYQRPGLVQRVRERKARRNAAETRTTDVSSQGELLDQRPHEPVPRRAARPALDQSGRIAQIRSYRQREIAASPRGVE